MVAERTRLAGEAQKKAAAEAAIIIANQNQSKTPAVAPEPFPNIEETPKTSEATKSLLTTTQWLTVGTIIVGLLSIYYKRKELKAAGEKVFSKTPACVEPKPQPPPVQATPTPQPKGLRFMED